MISSDRFPVYSHLGVGFRQIGWSPLIRDFLAASEKKNEVGEIGKRLFKTGIQILWIWKRVREGTLSRSEFIKNYLGRYRKRIRADLELALTYPKRKLGIVAKTYWIVLTRCGNLPMSRCLNRQTTRRSANFGNW